MTRGKTQQLVDAVERDGDVEHDGRTCGRTATYALVDYLRSDKATPLAGDFSFSVFFLSFFLPSRRGFRCERKRSRKENYIGVNEESLASPSESIERDRD